MALQFAFVELEAPSKRAFKNDGSFTNHFHQARQLVTDWVRWSVDHKEELVRMFAPPFASYNAAEDFRDVRAYLVYGHDRCRRQTIAWNPHTKRIYKGSAFVANFCIY